MENDGEQTIDAEETAATELLAGQALLLEHVHPTFHEDYRASRKKNVQLRFFDDARYRGQERTMNLDARVHPSVLRFVSVCQALQSGFRAASRPPVDHELGKRKWIAAALELVAENPLKNPANTWKPTLTLHDRLTMSAAFGGVFTSMGEWVAAVRDLAVNSDAEDWGGLAAAIWREFIEPNGRMEGMRFVANYSPDCIFRHDAQGGLQLDDSRLRTLRRACSDETNAADAYREGECPADCFGKVRLLDIGWEFNHEARCIECQEQVRLTNDFLIKRIDLYNDAKDVPARRAVLTFDADANRWSEFYLREYCQPTPYHAVRSSRDVVIPNAITELLDSVDYNTASLCDHVYLDTGKSETAAKMHRAWGEIRGLYLARCASTAMPSYAQQERFAEKLCTFMNLFQAAVQEINCVRKDEPDEKRQPPAAGTEDPVENNGLRLAPRLKKDFIKEVDFKNQTIVFKVKEPLSGKKSITIKKTPKNALWNFLVPLLTQTKDSGWVTLPRAQIKWHGLFRRTAPGNPSRTILDPTQDPMILFYHILPDKDQGDEGATRIRFGLKVRQAEYDANLKAYLKWKRESTAK